MRDASLNRQGEFDSYPSSSSRSLARPAVQRHQNTNAPACPVLPACLPLVRQENLLLVLGLLCEL